MNHGHGQEFDALMETCVMSTVKRHTHFYKCINDVVHDNIFSGSIGK